MRPKLVSSLDQVIIIDGAYLGKRDGEKIVVLIARTKTQVVGWRFASIESAETWVSFLKNIGKPKLIVCDGQKGMLKAIKTSWDGEVVVQRCLFHIQSRALGLLTRNPTQNEAKQLRAICRQICSIDSLERRDWWLDLYFNWKRENSTFIKQRAEYFHPLKGKLVSYYIHFKVRAVISLIDNALPNMFHYLNHPNVPRTTNHLEGGINSRLKELIYRHRGLSMRNKLLLASRYLRNRQKPKT